ncbi:MAG: leucine-rich repeat domain-containing protein [Treponema sp.]|nr:leucine-rich repeat domain-containing protein [Treponema sp.]
MKNRKYYTLLPLLVILAALVVFSFSIISCPPIEEETYSSIKKLTGPLTYGKWIDALDEIYTAGIPVTLDLSECTVSDSGSDVLKHTHEDGSDFVPCDCVNVHTCNRNLYDDYIQFNPSMGSRFGKNFITSIIIPDIATMISNASGDLDIIDLEDSDGDETIGYAFRHFSRLKTVTGKRISLLGTLAFYDCTSLEEVSFPNLVIVMQYAFYNCANLKKAEFEKLRHIQPSAFKNCKSLERIEFHNADVIAQSAFMGCTGLIEVSLSNAISIEPEAFKNCSGLKIARFHATPMLNGFPLNLSNPNEKPWLPGTLAFHNNVFRGCTSLEILDVRNAWNVYFGEGALADIGTHLDLHLYDDKGTGENAGGKSYGHPQLGMLLGDVPRSNDKGGVSLQTLNIVASSVDPIEASRILYADYTSIKKSDNPLHPITYNTSSIRNWINSTYNPGDRDEYNNPKNSLVKVTVSRRPSTVQQ